jgi:hypothetical protein
MPKRPTDARLAAPQAPAQRAVEEDAAIVMEMLQDSAPLSFWIKVESRLAERLGLVAEWKRLVEMCRTNVRPATKNNDADSRAVAFLSCATFQLDDYRDGALADMRKREHPLPFFPGDDTTVCPFLGEPAARARDSVLFSALRGAPVIGMLRVDCSAAK